MKKRIKNKKKYIKGNIIKNKRDTGQKSGDKAGGRNQETKEEAEWEPGKQSREGRGKYKVEVGSGFRKEMKGRAEDNFFCSITNIYFFDIFVGVTTPKALKYRNKLNLQYIII